MSQLEMCASGSFPVSVPMDCGLGADSWVHSATTPEVDSRRSPARSVVAGLLSEMGSFTDPGDVVRLRSRLESGMRTRRAHATLKADLKSDLRGAALVKDPSRHDVCS